MPIRTSKWFVAVVAIFSTGTPSWATGILVPTDRKIECLSIVYQRLNIEIREQAAVTKVVQEFRNHTSNPLEAYYLFPLPKDAGVENFAMWVDGKKVEGEVVEANKARTVYEDVVRRLKDPGLLEHMGQNLWRVRVYPVPANGTQKIEISYSELVPSDAGVAEYRYPLRAGNKAFTTEQDFTVNVELHSQIPLKSVYSPAHDVSVSKKGDHKAVVSFEQTKYPLNRDFSLFWTVSEKDIGLSTLFHRPDKEDEGYFLALISPPSEPEVRNRVPRDVVFVVDTSGSMQGEKMEQAKGALKYCLNSLEKEDRFAVVEFSTSVRAFKDELAKADKNHIQEAVEWVDELTAKGGTAIDDALRAALQLRSDDNRNFTIVFLTDGLPTIGETNIGAILKNVDNRNTASTRIFTFGVGDDVNTHLLDQLAERTRSASVYVRANENIETKVSSFYAKVSHPVLTDLALKVVGDKVKLEQIYPPKLPDLFHGGQLTVLGRYKGDGDVVLRLTGSVGEEKRTFDHEVKFPKKETDHEFVSGIWARRKVGYLLDQIRINGEKSELVDEVVRLAKRYGIATPYTSYLVVPDEPQVAQQTPGARPFLTGGVSGVEGRTLRRSRMAIAGDEVQILALQPELRFEKALPRIMINEELEKSGTYVYRGVVRGEPAQPKTPASADPQSGRSLSLGGGVMGLGQTSGRQAVDFAERLDKLKRASDAATAARTVDGVRYMNVDGVWVDERVKEGAQIVAVQYLGAAYFKMLELHPELKNLFALGEHVLFLTPSGQAVLIAAEGKDEIPEAELRAWFESKPAESKE